MDLLELGNMMMNNATSELPQPFQTVSKSPAVGRGMAQASSMEGGLFFPFTNAQWNELERQAMVFKYMIHSIPVPYDLLFPFISSPSTTHPNSGLMIMRDTNLLLKFLKNGDAEPGRCRRTDGKKWRCANVVAIDQKYCEKHVHRGRPRSRKHVEETASATASSHLNKKIHKKPCLSQPHNHTTICPQVGPSLNLGAFHLRNGDLFRSQQHHLSLESYTQLAKQEDVQEIRPSNALIDVWTSNSNNNNSTSNTQHDLVSLGLSMGDGSSSYTNEDVSVTETKKDETHDWLDQSGGPLGEVLRPPLTLTPSSPTSANGACNGVLQEAVASLYDAARTH